MTDKEIIDRINSLERQTRQMRKVLQLLISLPVDYAHGWNLRQTALRMLNEMETEK